MEFAADPPALAKVPVAKSAGPPPSSNTVSARTDVLGLPFMPLPSIDQPDTVHFATPRVKAPPDGVKAPAAWTAGPLPSSNTVSAWTLPAPLPSTVQLVPFQRAAPLGEFIVPATQKLPPAKSLAPEPLSNVVRAATGPWIPLPSPDQVVPFHFATPFVAVLPEDEKLPPA